MGHRVLTHWAIIGSLWIRPWRAARCSSPADRQWSEMWYDRWSMGRCSCWWWWRRPGYYAAVWLLRWDPEQTMPHATPHDATLRRLRILEILIRSPSAIATSDLQTGLQLRRFLSNQNAYRGEAWTRARQLLRWATVPQQWAEFGVLLYPFPWGELGPHLTQCRPGQGLPPY